MIPSGWKRPTCLMAFVALAISSCAPTAQEPAKSKVTAAAPEPVPAPKRQVGMNERGKLSSISLTDCFTRKESGEILLFDARPYFFYALGHIPGAITMPKDAGEDAIDKHEAEIKAALATGKTVVVYCTNLLCPDARTVAIRLNDRGYNASTLTGGWESWKEAGLPTE